jgi:soluble lytic murein transglycosylase
MPRRLLYIVLAIAVVVITAVTFLLRRDGPDLVPEVMAGDVSEELTRIEPDDLPARARAFLATDRPWRAAQAMRRYLQSTPDSAADMRVLAARAEAGWGAWSQVHALLRDVAGLDTLEDGIGLYLLARARDDGGDAAGAAEAYTAFLALRPSANGLQAERDAARLRLGLALVRAGRRDAAREHLQLSAQGAGTASVWLDLLAADALARTGDTAAVRAATTAHTDGVPGLRAWRARVTAAWQAGDIAGARQLANQARAWASTNETRAEFLVSAARAAAQMGDVAAARDALRSAIDLGPATSHARAAAALLRSGDMSAADHLASARVLSAQGLHAEAVPGYRRWLDNGSGLAAQRTQVTMDLANALFYAGEYADAVRVLQPLAGHTPAQFLRARAEAHRGRTDEAVRIYLSLAERFPRAATGTEALFLAAGVRHDAGDADRARTLYQRVVRQYPGSDRAGLSMMRLAGIAFHNGEHREAARIWDEYRARFPRGSRALQALYWAGRARAALGDSAGAASMFREVRQRERDSYYALLASERLGIPFWPLPAGAGPGRSAGADQRVAGWMRGIDLLRAAGFTAEASAEANRVLDNAGTERATLYALAEALAERGYSQRAVRIGLRLQGSGTPDLRLLRILYPLPYRTLIIEEARDRDIDPFIATALIRQESMFEAGVTSHAGARGLMQIMPATGRQLADAVGIEPWDDELLYHPEINVHLGTRYLARHMENYDGSLPSVFSAYNAGSHRVGWWSDYAEYGNDELFTERIPFAETRNYVKILTRNRALYAGLYGDS